MSVIAILVFQNAATCPTTLIVVAREERVVDTHESDLRCSTTQTRTSTRLRFSLSEGFGVPISDFFKIFLEGLRHQKFTSIDHMKIAQC